MQYFTGHDGLGNPRSAEECCTAPTTCGHRGQDSPQTETVKNFDNVQH